MESLRLDCLLKHAPQKKTTLVSARAHFREAEEKRGYWLSSGCTSLQISATEIMLSVFCFLLSTLHNRAKCVLRVFVEDPEYVKRGQSG
jgi:hypothetical protein